MQESNFNNNKIRQFIYRGNGQRELQLYIEKSIWFDVKSLANKYHLSESEFVRNILVFYLANYNMVKNFEEYLTAKQEENVQLADK